MRIVRYLALFVLVGLAMGPPPAAGGPWFREAPKPAADPRLHLVSVGVDDTGLIEPLLYARSDAEAFARVVSEIASPIYEKVYSEVLLDPTKADVLAMVRKQMGRQGTRDTFAFYFAGNEFIDDEGEFRLLLRSPGRSEVLTAPSDDERELAAREASLSVRELYSLLAGMPAQNRFIVLDTCNADRALDAIGVLESASTRSEMGDLDRRLVCIGVEGVAFESTKLKGGTLTAALLEGADGAADRLLGAADADGILTAREMEAWCLARLPRLNQELGGGARSQPCTYARGGDFPLGRVSLPISGAPEPTRGDSVRGADREGPRIELLSPPPVRGALRIAEKDLELQLRVEDPSGVYEVLVDGQACTARDGKEFTVWTARVRLAPGEQEVLAEARDRGLNRSEKTWTIVRTTEGLAARQKGRVGRDYALVVGIDDYEHWGRLENPVHDARTLAKELKEAYGFETEIIENPGRRGLLEKLREYTKRTFEPGDQLLVFVAGHGHLDEDTGTAYVIPKDAAAKDELGETYVSHMKVVTWLDRIPCDHVLLVLDVCFGGAFFESRAIRANRASLYADVENLEFIRKKLSRRTRKWMTSGGSEYVPDGNRQVGHSPFAFRLLEALRVNAEAEEAKILTFAGLFAAAERAKPGPRAGGFGGDAPGSDFLFIPARGADRSSEVLNRVKGFSAPGG